MNDTFEQKINKIVQIWEICYWNVHARAGALRYLFYTVTHTSDNLSYERIYMTIVNAYKKLPILNSLNTVVVIILIYYTTCKLKSIYYVYCRYNTITSIVYNLQNRYNMCSYKPPPAFMQAPSPLGFSVTCIKWRHSSLDVIVRIINKNLRFRKISYNFYSFFPSLNASYNCYEHFTIILF